MVYVLKYIPNENGLIVEYSGVIDSDEFIEAYEARFSDAKIVKKLKYIISDFSKITELNITKEDVIKAADIANQASELNNNIVVAGIHPTQIVYGMGRMWQAYADDDITGWKTKSFKNRTEAIKWLASNFEDHLYFK